MFEKFYPGAYEESTYKIDFNKYYEKGYRGIIFDIDNTLVPHGLPSTRQSEELFNELRKIGYETCLISNNQEPRVKPFAEKVKSKYVSNAHKPSIKNYVKAMDIMKTDKNNTIFVGDQLFTDVYGANRTGIFSILVKPINKKEEIQIILKRYLEKVVLYFYNKKNS